MASLNLTPDELLTTTRSVRKRLDFSRPVEPELINQCLELAVQAPSGANSQRWHFVVVTDADKRAALGELYRKGWAKYTEEMAPSRGAVASKAVPDDQAATLARVLDSAQYLADHMHEVPAMLIPCVRPRTDGLPAIAQAGVWGSVVPAVWSFMLAARARGLGTCWTTVHLYHEQEVADLLGIPFQRVMQVALVPVAHTLGADFKPGARVPLEKVAHWETW
jgi:nitroreductase